MLDDTVDVVDGPEVEWRELDIPTTLHGERLDRALAILLPEFSRSFSQQLLSEGCVSSLLPESRVVSKASARVRMGERYRVTLRPTPQSQAFKPEAMDLNVVYQDDDLRVIHKPAGLVVHPAPGNWSGTLLNGLLALDPQAVMLPRAGIVHRLDKDTSGLMVVAKTLESHTDLVRQLQDRTVSREYMALVWGAPRLRSRIEAAIGRHPRDRLKMAVLESETAKPAVTHYERIATGTLDRHRVSLVRCRLETGRTHQIRVHMLSIGFPLVGDTSYGKQHLAHFFPRQALHACHLGLIHPHTGEECAWDAPLPEDFAALLELAGIKDFEQK